MAKMTRAKALEIVLNLAEGNALSEDETDGEPALEEAATQQAEAIEIVRTMWENLA